MLPDAGVVRTDCAQGDCAERQPLPAAVTRKPRDRKSPAEWAYQRLILYVQKFEERLDADHEVGMGFAGSDAGMLRIKGMGYFAPDIVTFYGVDQHGQKTQLIQHVSQLSVMLKAAPKQHDKAERIGFQLGAGLEDQGGEGAGETGDKVADEGANAGSDPA
ncbi:MAG TPA: DUF6173 family protein [Paracoccaceae bacterium]|nr:DUF6173 family protein [Paracoccaceae bacterium]